jgi:hypothetical protein
MKKIFLLLAMVSTAAFTGCTINDDQPDVIENNYFEAEAFHLDGINLGFEPTTGRYEYLVEFDQPLFPSDVILVYRWTSDNGTGVWQQIPRTLHLNQFDEVDYDFNFNRNDLLIFVDATFDLATTPEFRNNQSFRVVIIPAYDPTEGRIDFSDYNAVAQRFNIKEANIKALN